MLRADPAKAKEAAAEVALADKALAKTLFKWAPDYMAAEPHLKRAGACLYVLAPPPAAAPAL